MYRKKPEVDVIMDILNAAVEAYPGSSFVQSLWRIYQEKGGLSKGQLQGLYAKAAAIPSLPQQKLATLQAEIQRRPTRFKSNKPAHTPLYQKDADSGRMMEEILQHFPHHKRVLYLQTKWKNNEPLTPVEAGELEKFHKLLMTKIQR